LTNPLIRDNLEIDNVVYARHHQMIECSDLENKVVRKLKIFQNPSPEVHIEFTDGTIFSASLNATLFVDAKCIRDEGGEPVVLAEYTPAP
jgi:hypothetical protein